VIIDEYQMAGKYPENSVETLLLFSSNNRGNAL